MAGLSMEDVNLWWEETPHHNWSALHDTLERQVRVAMGISDRTLALLLSTTDRLARSGEPYPGTPEELFEVLSREISARA